MSLLPELLDAINARKNKALRLVEVGLTESQFRAFRGLFLDEFGRSGLERDLERIVAEHERRHGTALGRHIQAGKEVPHG